MQAIKINIAGTSFLLPESHSDHYEFPTYITDHKPQIEQCVSAYQQWLKSQVDDMPPVPDMSEFKQKTGIIGIPFNMHDVQMYALTHGVDIVMEVDL